MELGGSRSDLHGRWLRRYGLRDPVAQWRVASRERAPTLAFIAVASDGGIFRKVSPGLAAKLAQQAERLAQDALASPETVATTRVAAQAVVGRVEAWRDEMEMAGGRTGWVARGDPEKDWRGAGRAGAGRDAAELSDEALFTAALSGHPYYDEGIARRLAAVTIELGAGKLVRLGGPADAALVFGAARFAGRSLRGRVGGERLCDEGVAAVLAAAEGWARAVGANPLVTDFQDARDVAVSQSIGLAADAAACAEAAERMGLGMEIWDAAHEFHAYGVVSIQSRFLATMDYDGAQRFASAAARLAARAMADPEVRLPRPPPGVEAQEPRLVMASAKAVLREGVLPRRTRVRADGRAPVTVVQS